MSHIIFVYSPLLVFPRTQRYAREHSYVAETGPELDNWYSIAPLNGGQPLNCSKGLLTWRQGAPANRATRLGGLKHSPPLHAIHLSGIAAAQKIAR